MTISRNTNIETFKTDLKRHGLKATPQRLAVHQAMMKLGHASADMVTDEIKKNGATKVTVASVYNILTNLALLGIYDHRMSSNNKMYFDVNTFKHLHIYDCENHEYRDVIDEELLDLVEKHLTRRKFKGYRIEDIDIQLIGRPTRRKSKSVSA
ncbi:MAG: transcriptional repressor [Bacteroidetes bacterium]|uniref:Transcriptional repressor n=1 Tax=Candidatus Cryptobacteroides avicola TaxID=2840757 RepID=A0A940IJ53_9BACT|nr:transcriptional repressor [Candidatus Cryptobacteroides avicola]